MPSCNQKKRSKQRAEYLQKQDENKAKDQALYKANPEKKKASVSDSYKADPEKKMASDNYNALTNARRTVLLKGGKIKMTSRENCAANRQKYEDNSAAIKASKRSRYWNDPAVRLAKCASERTRYRRGHRTTTTTQRYVMACCINIKKLCMQHL